jgi:hypothetical protein
MAHQPLDATAAHPAGFGLQLDMDTRAAIASVDVAMDPLDVVSEVTISSGSLALRARAPGIIAGRQDTEQTAHDCHGVFSAAIFDERNLMSELQQISRSTLLKCRVHAQPLVLPLQTGKLRGVIRRQQRHLRCGGRDATVGSRPTQRRCTQRRNTSSLATDPTKRLLEATRSTCCCL